MTWSLEIGLDILIDLLYLAKTVTISSEIFHVSLRMDILESLTQNYFAIFESKAGEKYIYIYIMKKKLKSTAILLRDSNHPSIYAFEI